MFKNESDKNPMSGCLFLQRVQLSRLVAEIDIVC